MRSGPRSPASTARTARRRSGRSWRSAHPSSAVADVGDQAAGQQAAVDELLELLRIERGGDDWVGTTPDWYGPMVFGGIALALIIRAACADAPGGSRLH